MGFGIGNDAFSLGEAVGTKGRLETVAQPLVKVSQNLSKHFGRGLNDAIFTIPFLGYWKHPVPMMLGMMGVLVEILGGQAKECKQT